MIRRILAYVLIGLGALTYLFFRNYSGTLIPYPLLCYFVGIGMVISGVRLWVKTPSAKEIQEREQIVKLIDELKAKGEKIIVDFSKCEIKSNDFTEERERYTGSRMQMWNNISGDSDKNVEQIDVYQSVIVFKHECNGKTETFMSAIIPKERTTLMFKLSDKKETTLYVNEHDRNQYYFDMEFLQN